MTNQLSFFAYNFDPLAFLMVMLISFVGLCVFSFSMSYMKGDSKFYGFCVKFIFLISSMLSMVVSDNLVVIFLTYCLSNALLVSLMIHKSNWPQAEASGFLAGKNFAMSGFCVGAAFSIFYYISGQVRVQDLIVYDVSSPLMMTALVLLLLGAMMQSAVLPFHGWLISSLNSPTPVSAIMHAGLINGGGFLLARFAPLYAQHYYLLLIIFVVGLISAFVGDLWKLLQSDVKRTLACSTMGQMGFMVAQCGMGLFSVAVAHLIWHGLFKSYLFLVSSSVGQEKRFASGSCPSLSMCLYAAACGLFGTFIFGYITSKSWFAGDTTFVLMALSLLVFSQFALQVMFNNGLKSLVKVFVLTVLFAMFYGYNVSCIAGIMKSMHIDHTQPLHFIHILSVVIMVLIWFAILYLRYADKNKELPAWVLKLYVLTLNASQPHVTTVTSFRNDYKSL